VPTEGIGSRETDEKGAREILNLPLASSTVETPSSDPSVAARTRKRRCRRTKKKVADPEISDRPLLVDTLLDGEAALSLPDSGS
jgi:hypothetical protein